MQIPNDKRSLAVFLRDYNGRRAKKRSEKIQIMKTIITEKKIVFDNGIIHNLNDEEFETIEALYHKHVIGKMKAEVTHEDILKVLCDKKGLPLDCGKTIADIAELLGCTKEIIRKKLIKMDAKGDVRKGYNPDKKNEGIFYARKKEAEVIIPESVLPEFEERIEQKLEEMKEEYVDL
jgi:predicted transcriptional regulator